MECSKKLVCQLNKTEKICRTCLARNDNPKHILDEELGCIYYSLTGLKIQKDDNVTTWLCQHCHTFLCRMIHFRNVATESDVILRKHLSEQDHKHIPIKHSAIKLSAVQSINACNNCDGCQYNNIEMLHNQSFQESSPKNIYYILSKEIDAAVETRRLNSNILKDTPMIDSEILTPDFSDKQKHTKRCGKVKNKKVLAQIKFEKVEKKSKYDVKDCKNSRGGSQKIKCNKIDERFENVYIDDVKHQIYEEFITVESLQFPVRTRKSSRKRKGNYEHQLGYEETSNGVKYNINPLDISSEVPNLNNYSVIDENNSANKKIKVLKDTDDSKTKVKFQKKKNKANVLDKTKIEIIDLNRDQQIYELKMKSEDMDFVKALFKCTKCVKSFPYLESYEIHMKRHEKTVGPFKCSICEQYCTTQATMRGHALTHSLRFKCRMCDKIFHHKFTAQRHLLRHDGVFMCKACPETFSDKKKYSEHLKTHNTAVTVFGCPMCPKTFQAKCNYNIHIRKHTGELGFPCEQCDSVFASAAARSSHSSVHLTTKDFYCAACDASFKTGPKLQYHLRTSANHIDASHFMFTCDQCPRRYATQLRLTAHVDAAHSKEARYSCKLCPALYRSANGLYHHRRKVHEGKMPERNHTCDTCGRSFINNIILINHIRTHTGEQPFECPTCCRRFSQKAAMQTHIKLVHLKLKRNVALKSKISSLGENKTNLPLNLDNVESHS